MASDGPKAWLIVFVLVSLGLSFISLGGVSTATYYMALSDPQPVQATILESDVRFLANPGRGGADYEPYVLYEYQAPGNSKYAPRQKRSDTIFAGFGPATLPGKDAAQSVANRYHPGENVTVYVASYGGWDTVYLVGSGPRVYAYYGFFILGIALCWSGFGLALYRVVGVDLPMRVRIGE